MGGRGNAKGWGLKEGELICNTRYEISCVINQFIIIYKFTISTDTIFLWVLQRRFNWVLSLEPFKLLEILLQRTHPEQAHSFLQLSLHYCSMLFVTGDRRARGHLRVVMFAFDGGRRVRAQKRVNVQWERNLLYAVM